MTQKVYTTLTAIARNYIGLLKSLREAGTIFLRHGDILRPGSQHEVTAQFLYLLNFGFWFLLRDEKWKEIFDLFYQRIGSDQEFKLYRGRKLVKGFEVDKVVDHEGIFFATLAKFCEPLIKGTAEKPEGGQDAAKV